MKSISFVGLLIFLAMPAMAQTTILIDDTFNRTGNLVGSTPTTTGGSASGAQWVASLGTGSATTNGSQLAVATPAQNQDYVGIQIQTSNVWMTNSTYTFTFILPSFTNASDPTHTDNWLSFGLDTGNSARSDAIGNLSVVRGNASGQWYGASTAGVVGTTSHAVTNSAAIDNATSGTDVVITLDTATDTENFYIGTTTATGTPDYSLTMTALPALSNGLWVAVQDYNNNATTANAYNFTEIKATVAADGTPEPSTYAMLLVGVGTLAFIIRARRAATV